MEAQDFHSLQEAYMEVYSVDEGLGSAIKKLFGGKKKEAEAPKPPMSRGEYLRQRYNVGPERSDTSAKRKILDRSRAKAERDEREYGDSKYSKSVAINSRDAHNRYLRAGYRKYGGDDARGRGNKARKRAAALQKEEFDNFDIILSHLLDEGYAETLKSAKVIMENMSEDWRYDILEGKKELPREKMKSKLKSLFKKRGTFGRRKSIYKTLVTTPKTVMGEHD